MPQEIEAFSKTLTNQKNQIFEKTYFIKNKC